MPYPFPVNHDSWANVDSLGVMMDQLLRLWINVRSTITIRQSTRVFCIGWLELALRWLKTAQPTPAHLVHNFMLNVERSHYNLSYFGSRYYAVFEFSFIRMWFVNVNRLRLENGVF